MSNFEEKANAARQRYSVVKEGKKGPMTITVMDLDTEVLTARGDGREYEALLLSYEEHDLSRPTPRKGTKSVAMFAKEEADLIVSLDLGKTYEITVTRDEDSDFPRWVSADLVNAA